LKLYPPKKSFCIDFYWFEIRAEAISGKATAETKWA